MVFTEPRPPIDHLSVPDVARLIKEIKPKVAILSHFGMHVWQAKPWKIAEEMTRTDGDKGHRRAGRHEIRPGTTRRVKK